MAHDRLVAGIRCNQVLGELSDYVDGDLAAQRIEQIEAHLAGCDWCERFGGEFAGAVRALRGALTEAPRPPEGVRARLRERLRRALS